EIGAVQRHGIEIARRERQRSFQEWSLQAGVIGAGAEADRVRVGLALLHRMNKLVASDPVVENAAAAAQHEPAVGSRLPGETNAWREGRQRNSILAGKVAVMDANAVW